MKFRHPMGAIISSDIETVENYAGLQGDDTQNNNASQDDTDQTAASDQAADQNTTAGNGTNQSQTGQNQNNTGSGSFFRRSCQSG